MWIVITACGILALVAFVALRMVSAPPSRPDPEEQPLEPHIDDAELPEPGEDSAPRRSDGRIVPGSEEDRNRHGRP